jgi:uncharacterized protein YutE (UPF0331/DUF86 family)
LERGGWIAPEMAATLRDMVGFRNVLVYGYDIVNLDIVEDVVPNRLGDLLDFVAVIRRRLPAVWRLTIAPHSSRRSLQAR